MKKSPFVQNNVGARERFRRQYRNQSSLLISKPRKNQQTLKGQTSRSYYESKELHCHSKCDDGDSSRRQRHCQSHDQLPQSNGISRYSTRRDDSRERLLKNDHAKFESTAEISLSLRQSNVIRSPRVYNFSSSAVKQDETLKSDGTLVNSTNGRVQQVTVGPTESDSICEIFFQPQNLAVERKGNKISTNPSLKYSSHESLPWKQRSYSDAEISANRTDVESKDKLQPHRLVSTSSTTDRPTRINGYTTRRSMETNHSHLLGHQKPAITSRRYPSAQKNLELTSERLKMDENSRSHRDRNSETDHFHKWLNHPNKQNSTVPKCCYQSFRRGTALNIHQPKEQDFAAPIKTARERKSGNRYSDKNPHRYSDSHHHQDYQYTPQMFDSFKSYKGYSVPEISNTDYFAGQSPETSSSIGFGQSYMSNSVSTNHNLDSFSSEYDVTMRDADREHYLNQKILQTLAENGDERQGKQHLVESNYGSSAIETKSHTSSDFPDQISYQKQSCDSLTQINSDSSLHISELDSNSSDYEWNTSPVKPSLKSKSKHPTLIDDFGVYHKTGPAKQVHFKDPISVAKTISTITLEELGMTSEASDHDINVVELEEDGTDNTSIDETPINATLKPDVLTVELESKRLQDAGNTPKIARTRQPVNCERPTSELEMKPFLIQSFEQSMTNHESQNTASESCCLSTKTHLSDCNSGTYGSSKINRGTNTELKMITDHKHVEDPEPQHGDHKKKEARKPVRECNGRNISHQTRDALRHGENFDSHRRGEEGTCNPNTRLPDPSSTDFSEPQLPSKSSCKENVIDHHHGNKNVSTLNEKHRCCGLSPDALPVAVQSPLSSAGTDSEQFSSVLVDGVASPVDDTVLVQHIPRELQRIKSSFTNVAMTSTRSKDYRMMQLQAVIDCSPPKDRLNILIKARYFCRWKDNVRLLVRIKKRELRKAIRAESFYRVTALAKHFFSWRGFILEQQIAADEFHYRCMLKTGMRALHWATVNRKIKASQDALGRKKVKLSSCFRKWRTRVKSRRIDKLRTLFFRWRQRLHEKLIVAKFEDNRHHTKQHQVLKTWQERLLGSMQTRISSHHYNSVLIEKIWHTWRVYTADHLVKSSQRNVANVKHEFSALCKSFAIWKRMTRQKQFVLRFRNKKVLSLSFQTWRIFASFESLRHQKELNAARQARRRHLLTRHFRIWMTQLKLLDFKKKRINDALSCCLLVWKAQMNRHQVIHAEVVAHHNFVVKKQVLMSLKQHAVRQKHRRKNAIKKFKYGVLRRHLECWHSLSARKSQLRDMRDVFRSSSDKKCKQRTFSKWKSQFAVILNTQEAAMQWNLTCVTKAARNWLYMVKLKQMERICTKAVAARNRIVLQSCLQIWKLKLRRIVRQDEKAAEAEQYIRREKMRKLLHQWHLKSCESAHVRPFVTALQEKRASRYFNSWMLFVRRNNLMRTYCNTLSLNSARNCFMKWKRQLHDIENTRIARQEYDHLLMRRCLRKWIQFYNRQHSCMVLSNHRTQTILAHCFTTWVMKTRIRQIAEAVKLRDAALKKSNAQQLCERWKEESTKRREKEDMLVSGLIERRAQSSKRTTFAAWRQAFCNLQTAEHFASENITKKLKGLLHEWHRITESSIQAQLNNFTSSVMSQHTRNFRNKGAHCDSTMPTSITETSSSYEIPYSACESNNCFEAKFELLSLSQLANGAHDEIAPLGSIHDLVASPVIPRGILQNRISELYGQTNCCADSGILSKEVTTATPSETAFSSTSSIQESVRPSKQDISSYKTLTVEDLAKSQDSNIGSSVIEENKKASSTKEDSSESVSSLSSGCSDDPTLSSSTISQPLPDDPYLRPILSDLSHLSSLPINHNYKWERKPDEYNKISESVNHDTSYMAHTSHGHNCGLSTSKTLSQKYCDVTDAELNKEKSPTNSCLTSPVNWPSTCSESKCSPAYFTPESTPTQHRSSMPMPEITSYDYPLYPESLKRTCTTEQDVSPEKLDLNLTGCANVESSVMLALSHPATHISDLSSPLYFTPNSTPSRHKSDKFPYPSGAAVLSPLQSLETRRSLDIMTEQMEQHFSQSNYLNQDVVFKSEDIQTVVVHSPKYLTDHNSLSESDDTMSLSSSDDCHESSYQQVERSHTHFHPEPCDNVPASSKPKFPTHLTLWNSGVSPSELLVRFALVRLRHRPIAFAFHQWKMLIHMKLWKQEMLTHAYKISAGLRIKQHFRVWRNATSQMIIAKDHFNVTIIKRSFSKVLIFTKGRIRRQKLLTKALLQKNHIILVTHLQHWQKKFQQKNALLEILQYWQRKTQTTSHSIRGTSRFEIRRSKDRVVDCFYHWRMKIQQIRNVDKYCDRRSLSRCFLAWRNWICIRKLQKARAEDFYSKKLEMRVFQALKEHASLSLNVRQREVECRKKVLSTMLHRWHVYTQSSRHRQSVFDKLSAEKILQTKALCFNIWRCETVKRIMAGVLYRRTLGKKILLSWKAAVENDVYEKESCRRVQELVDSHSKEGVLSKWFDEALMRSKVNSLKHKHLYFLIVDCWSVWNEKVALKKSDKLYKNFLKKRCFHHWVYTLQIKRKRNQKIQAMLRRWHAISSRSKKLSRMGDQFQLKSNNLITDLTFNLWLIARQQSHKARAHHEHTLASKVLSAWISWNKKKRTLQKMVQNHVQYRSKERFAIAWHTWKHRCRVHFVDNHGIMLHQKAASVRTLRYHWLTWRRKKLEIDSSRFYDNKLLCQATQTWFGKFENLRKADDLHSNLVNRRLRKALLTWHSHVSVTKSERKVITDLNDTRSEIITMTTFVTWLKAYKNFKIAASCHEKSLKQRCFAGLISWRKKQQCLRESYSHTVYIVYVTTLSSCLSQWKSLYRKSRMMQVSCGHSLEMKKLIFLRKLWQIWFKAKEKRDIKRIHLHNLVVEAARKWRTYAITRVNKSQIKKERSVTVDQFKHKWLCKIYFAYWHLQFKGNNTKSSFQTNFMQQCWTAWKQKTMMSLCAASISKHQILSSSWRIWRLEFVKLRAVEESAKDRNRDMIKDIFKAWRSLTVQARTELEEYELTHSTRKPLTPRKSRIPILQK